MSGYTIRKIGDLPPEEAALIRQDVAEAERGYSLEELEEGAKRMRESSFGVGDVPNRLGSRSETQPLHEPASRLSKHCSS